jgi:predicted nucleotidyltransferase
MNKRIKPRAVIQKIVERLVAEYPPQKIILFGSYAYGQPDPDSDIDLLIIKATGEGFLERLHTVRRVTVGTHPSVPFDPIVLTPTEMADRLEAGDQFLREILDRGELLYAA